MKEPVRVAPMDGFPRRGFIFFLSLLVWLSAYGCGSPINSAKAKAPAYDPNASGSDPLNPVVGAPASDAAGMFMKITSTTANFTLHRADADYADATNTRQTVGVGNKDVECRIATDAATADRNILCIAEVEELDLYFGKAMTLQYHVPPSMCAYAAFQPYYFYGLRPGAGPQSVSYEIMPDGSIVDQPDSNGDINSENGVPKCTYDYSPGPNCCSGDYALTVNDNGVLTTTVGNPWNGKAANCLAGPAMTGAWGQYISPTTGVPIYRLEYVEGVGLNSTFSLEAPLDISFNGLGVSSSVWLANFYNPGDHVGGVGTVPGTEDINRPVPLRVPPGGGAFPQDSYILNCLDRAEEVQARIRLMIREWNTETEYASFLAGNGGDPDVTSIGADPNEPNFPDSPYNDRLDWLDFGISYADTSI